MRPISYISFYLLFALAFVPKAPASKIPKYQRQAIFAAAVQSGDEAVREALLTLTQKGFLEKIAEALKPLPPAPGLACDDPVTQASYLKAKARIRDLAAKEIPIYDVPTELDTSSRVLMVQDYYKGSSASALTEVRIYDATAMGYPVRNSHYQWVPVRISEAEKALFQACGDGEKSGWLD